MPRTPDTAPLDSAEGLSALLGRKQARYADLIAAPAADSDSDPPPSDPPPGSSEVPLVETAADPASRGGSPRTILTGLYSRQRGPSGQGSSVSAAGFAFPALGDEVFGFRLRYQLGAGAFARVFLAEQTGLAGRPVVLKVSDCSSDEPQTLAQLRHTNIAPVYSVHESPAGLRAVCMPYFGGANLAAVLHQVWHSPAGPRPGGDGFLAALDAVRAPSLAELINGREATPLPAPGRTPRDALCVQPGVRAAVWVAARLAAGLQHAHDQGIYHRDIKPSNVLVAEDGQPMLLDFNLSHKAAGPDAASIGGTIAYMSPEHLRAIGTGADHLIRAVDHRSDVYSLGMVLFEMLTGVIPFDHGGSYAPSPLIVEAMAVERERVVPSPRLAEPDVSWGLDGIVRKCLDPNPARRYQRAADLADDLDRFLTDRPLAHAAERSVRERAAKWARRHPRATSAGSLGAVAAVLLAVTGVALAGVRAHLADTREALADARSRERMQAYQSGTVRALMLVNVNTDLHDPVTEGRAVCEDTLGRYGVLARDDWEADPDWQRVPPDARPKLAADTRELLLSLARARVRVANAAPAALADALALLDKAEAVTGLPPSPGLWHDRALYLRLAGRPADAAAARDRANAIAPADARDHYLTATALLRGGDPAARPRAVGVLDRAIALDPRFYWAWFQRGVCRLDAGEHQLAAADFGVCVGLWPEFAWGHFNLGLAHDRAGRKVEAVAAYDAALARAADFPSARVNRGLVRLEQKDYVAALADFAVAAAARPDDPSAHAGRGFALEALARPADADAAFARLTELLPAAPAPLRARLLVGYGSAVGRRLPGPAAEAFTAALAIDPADADAHYGLASLAADPDIAIGHLTRCLTVAPGRKDAALARAVLYARTGRIAEAIPVVERYLDRDPDDGAALYAGACVTALAAKAAPADADRWAEKALDLLRRATRRGQPAARAAADPDLAALRDRPGFADLIAGRGN